MTVKIRPPASARETGFSYDRQGPFQPYFFPPIFICEFDDDFALTKAYQTTKNYILWLGIAAPELGVPMTTCCKLQNVGLHVKVSKVIFC